MNLSPIIMRELRAEARHPINYALRTLGAAVLTGFLGFFLWGQENAQSGGSAFHALSFIVFCAIWIVVPLLTADCISRERREGTLGLLFLTPLKPLEIILGKGIIHAIRSLTLIVAVIPILTIPFVLGGINATNVFWSLLLNFTSLPLALAAGLLASSSCRQSSRAIILAEIFAALFLFVSFKAMAISLFGWSAWRAGFFDVLRGAYQSFFNSPRFQSVQTASGISPMQRITLLAIFVGAILFFGLIVFLAAHRLKKTWQENPPSPRQSRIQKIFCTPRFWVGFLRRSNESKLSRNPIGWLQQYSWSARLSKWGWCFAVITILSWFLANDFQFFYPGCASLKTAILISMAFSAVGSFQREKQNGALELLLVTPLTEGQIIFGRLRGIWGQFLPAFAILLFSMLSVEQFFSHSYYERNHPVISTWLCNFIAVPMVGLYFSMRIKSFMAAWLLTCLLTLFVPLFLIRLGEEIGISLGFQNADDAYQHASILLLTPMALGAGFLLHAQLRNRSFALGRL